MTKLKTGEKIKVGIKMYRQLAESAMSIDNRVKRHLGQLGGSYLYFLQEYELNHYKYNWKEGKPERVYVEKV